MVGDLCAEEEVLVGAEVSGEMVRTEGVAQCGVMPESLEYSPIRATGASALLFELVDMGMRVRLGGRGCETPGSSREAVGDMFRAPRMSSVRSHDKSLIVTLTAAFSIRFLSSERISWCPTMMGEEVFFCG